jgi:acyl carrier protein
MLENEDFELEIKILEILKRGRPEVDFESSSDMVLDGLIDSFEIVMLTTEFEKSFGVNIPGEDIIPESFATIAAMAKLVRKLQVRD